MTDKPGTPQSAKEARRAGYRQQMIAKWRAEMQRIESEVVTLYQSRSIYRRLFEIVHANPQIHRGNALYEWLHRSYVVSASAAIRRLLDEHKDALSLANAVGSIRSNKSVLTREWFVSQYRHTSRFPEFARRNADQDFDKLAGMGKSTADGEDLQRRLDRVRSLSRLILEYVDKLVAHADRNPPSELPTYPQLDEAIDALGDLFRYLHALLNQASWHSLEPVETFRWEGLFEEPWIRPDNQMNG